MRIKLDIDCTPEELRGFFGLPDVRAMQEQLLKEVEAQMRAGIKALDPEAMLKTWLPAGMQGFEKLQEMFLGQMGGGGPAVRNKWPSRCARRGCCCADGGMTISAAFAAMSAHPAVMRYPPPPDPDWISRMRAHWREHGFGQFVVELPGEAPFIGVVGLAQYSLSRPVYADG